jgi:hypothetical protein
MAPVTWRDRKQNSQIDGRTVQGCMMHERERLAEVVCLMRPRVDDL